MDEHDLDVTDDVGEFAEAVRAFREMLGISKEEIEELFADELVYAKRVAASNAADIVTQVIDALEAAVSRGTTFETFKGTVGEMLEQSWGGEQPGLLETVFRTNVIGAYNAGRHEIHTAPTVKKARSYWRFSKIQDSRVSDICRPCEGVIVAADDPWWDTHYPLLHFNALLPWTKITTSDGVKRISDVRVGDLVLTHRGRLRPVTATMSKRPDHATFRRVEISTGRVLCITDEHPVLTSGGWLHAGELQVGDLLFQDPKEAAGGLEVAVHDPHDFPSIADEPFVPDQVTLDAGSAEVALAVDLQDEHVAWEGEVRHVFANRVLKHEEVLVAFQKIKGALLGWPGAAAEGVSSRLTTALEHAWHAGRVLVRHTLGVPAVNFGRLLAQPPGPMIWAGLGDLLSPALRGSLSLRTRRDSVLSARLLERRLAETKVPFDAAERVAGAPVALSDDCKNRASVGQINWRHAAIVSIADVPLRNSLWNLAVKDDETYVAEGVIVHNCRHSVDALSEEEAIEEGITRSPPHVKPQEGFGKRPSRQGRNWKPEMLGYPIDVREVLREKI